MPDIDKLNADLKFLEDHPQEHNQEIWVAAEPGDQLSCGTAFCLAGLRVAREYPTAVIMNYGYSVLLPVPFQGGQLWPFHVLAAKLYGLSREQAWALFDYSNTLPRMRAMVSYLAEYPDATRNELYAASRAYKRGQKVCTDQ